ncbi:MAG: septum site-determining protein MinC [Gammaproteobacteria bacterium]|nr:septum site-determining protein MinC [Gammaproteobacteria bacterium]NIR83114.1 septum site-determining protein MinC [Gammaproteobacteria bacterium]NIR90776.1 septum site-determining protein MinC [Gammaproteobacteria bacterium]NIU04267.1 septum site-determining protein MinC [Gammaproteobacteria bacterium]NIV51559.1 septum site-determining protein MinC [Gammaproteobacteria bacterium]
MAAQPPEAPNQEPALELKGTNFTLPVLKLWNADPQAVSRELEEKIAQAPAFFRHAPVVIDVSGIRGDGSSVDFAFLVGMLRSSRLIPVGIRGGDREQNELAAAMELAIMSEGSHKHQPSETQPARPSEGAGGAGTQLMSQPVRSGQRVYWQNGDLVVLGQVGYGAEVLADGNIHVYGALRGRALAGADGDSDARIFCQVFDAELVSIAGSYRVSEDFDDDLRGKPVQVYLEGRRLKVEAL